MHYLLMLKKKVFQCAHFYVVSIVYKVRRGEKGILLYNANKRSIITF